MKKLTISFLASLAIVASSFGGTEMKDFKEPVAEPCFKDTEFQLDVFGSYTDAAHRSSHDDGIGGGLGLNYFFTRNLGVALSGNLYDGDVHGAWNVDGSLVLRFPIEGGICLAPYILAGGGIAANGKTEGTWHAGGGLEWRVTHTIGLFGEGRYIWSQDEHSGTQVRAGLRFVF
ncbi:MAG: outer membrane beta-barrel protein [Chthoniobacteraceae bacterium]